MKKHNYSLIIGLILTGIILIITIIGQFWTPYAVTGMDSLAKNQAPSLIHLMLSLIHIQMCIRDSANTEIDDARDKLADAKAEAESELDEAWAQIQDCLLYTSHLQ